MKKLMISSVGLMMVSLMALPAAAEKGKRFSGESYRGDRTAHQSYSGRDRNHTAMKRDLKKERREFNRDMKHNFRAMKRADSPRERAKIRRNMKADYRDYKHDVRQVKRYYRHHNHYKPAPKYYKKGHGSPHRSSHYHGGPKSNYMAFGLWF